MIKKEGIYYHDRKGFALVHLKDDGRTWVVDKDRKKSHPFFKGFKLNVVENLTGDYYFEKSLKDYTFIGSLEPAYHITVSTTNTCRYCSRFLCERVEEIESDNGPYFVHRETLPCVCLTSAIDEDNDAMYNMGEI